MAWNDLLRADASLRNYSVYSLLHSLHCAIIAWALLVITVVVMVTSTSSSHGVHWQATNHVDRRMNMKRRAPSALTNKTESYLVYDNRTGRDYQSVPPCRLSIKFGTGVMGPCRAARLLVAVIGRTAAETISCWRWEARSRQIFCSVRTLPDDLKLFMTLARRRHGPCSWPLVCQLVTADVILVFVRWRQPVSS